MVPHINLSSFAGGGKTTISRLLLATYRTVMVPKITTRPRRPEEEIPEYIYVSRDEFEVRRTQGHFIAVEDIAMNGIACCHAIPQPELWPCVPEGTELILSAFGEQARAAQKYIPDLKLIFISLRERSILAQRLRHRCEIDGSNFEKKWAQNERYFQTHIEDNYDFVVYNDTSPQDCVDQIIEIIQR